MRAFLFALLCATVVACSPKGARCPARFSVPTQTTYSVHATELTPRGIALDPSGLPINPALVDRLTGEVEACLAKNFPGGVLSDSTVRNASCTHGSAFPTSAPWSCLTVKVASDWHLSETEFAGSYQQLLHDYVWMPDGCGKTAPTPNAPMVKCYWRAGVQDNMTIVTTPSMWVYKDPLVRIMTGCAAPWSDPKLTECMTPTTAPLSDGTGP